MTVSYFLAYKTDLDFEIVLEGKKNILQPEKYGTFARQLSEATGNMF